MTNFEVVKKLDVEQMVEVLFAFIQPFFEGDEEGTKGMKQKIKLLLLSQYSNPN